MPHCDGCITTGDSNPPLCADNECLRRKGTACMPAMAAPVTDLAQQLAQRAARHGVDQGKRHPGKASLLYSFQEAADIDAETIYRIGVEGLDQLCALDGRFQAYRRTLFGQASLALDRDAATADVNAKLDSAIAGFCTLLSSYFLLAPAFKALEFLVRKYKVHERNVEELMLAALPFHETEQFVRLVQILRLPPRGRFAFLEPMQASGAPAPRDVIVLRCVTDRSLLRFVCDMAQRQADPRLAGRVALPFYAVLVCEYLAKLKGVDEPLLTMMLPYLLAGLSESAVADYRAATYMIIGQLASRATFSADLATALVTETCRTASAGLLSSVVMLLAHLANTQEHLGELPDKAFKHLAKVSGLVDQLAALSDKGCRIDRLLALLVREAMAELPARPHYEQLLQALLARVQMGGAARALADAVLRQAGAAGEDDPHRHVLHRLLRTLDLRYPAAVDAAVDAALPQGGAAGGGAGAEEQQRHQRVLAALSSAFEGTARSPLLEAGTTVLLAAEAPAVAVRQLAVQRLDAIVAASPGSEAAAAAGAALLRRLQDDSPAVVQAVLGCASLPQLPQAALVDALASCFDRAVQQAGERSAKKAQRAEARGVARKALKLLTGPALAGAPQLLPRVLPLVLSALLVSPACGRKVVATAVKAARGLDSPLLAGLQGLQLPQDAAEGQHEEAAGKAGKAKKGGKKAEAAQDAAQAAAAAKRRKAAADAAYNARVVAALGAQAAGSSAAAAELCQALDSSGSGEPGAAGARPLLLLAAHAAVHGRGEGAQAVAAALLRQLRASDGAFQPADPLPKECFDANGVPTAAFLARGGHSGGALLSSVQLEALREAPWQALAPSGTPDALGLLRALCSLRWQPALSAFMARLAEQQLDPVRLLSELFAAPPAAEAVGVQLEAAERATALLHDRLAANRPGSGVGMSELGRALSVLCHPGRALRQAGVALAHACAQLLQADELSARARKQLVSALLEQAELLVADSEGLQRLVEALLGAGEEASAALAGCALAPGDAAGLGGALLAAAEEQAGAAAAAGRNAAAAATAAYVARQLLGLAAEWAPAAQLLGAASRLLASGARIRAAALGSPEGEQKEGLLVAAAACFTAPRLEALARQAAGEEAGAALEAWCCMLDPSSRLPAGARLAVLRQVEERFFSLLPAAQQGRCLKALLRAASRDGDEACRAAARAALAAMPLRAATLVPLLSLAPDAAAAGADDEMQEAEAAAEAEDEQDEELARLLAEAEAAAAAAKQGTPRSKQKRGGKSSKEQAAAEAAAAAAAAAVSRRRQQLAEQRQARQQGRAAAERGRGSVAAAPAGAAAGECCIAVLELLQWKENVQELPQLVTAVQDVLSQLLAMLAASGGEQDEDGEQAGAEEPAAVAGMAAAETVYVVQLCLSALAGMARSARRAAPPTPAQAPPLPTPGAKAKGKGRGKQAPAAQQNEGLDDFDLALAVRAARLAPDGAVRNSALELVAELALGMPEAALEHVLEVVAVVGASAALQEDEVSERVASQALRAILPAWTGAGKSVQELAAAVVAALPRVSRHRRLSLLAALVTALPQVEGLCSVLSLLLDQGVAQQLQQQAAAAAGEAAMAEADTLLAAGTEAEQPWVVDLAGDLMAQAPVLVQVQASAALLEHSLAASKQQPWQALPLLAVAFVTQQLEQRRRAASAAAAEELATAYQQLMQQCLLHLQRLGERQAAAQRGGAARGAAAPAAALRAGTAGCYRLLRALQQHMPAAAFLSALVALAGSSPADRVRRKALHLLAGVVRDAAADAVWQQQQQPEAAAAAAEAALAVCQPAQQLLEAAEGAPPAEGAEPVAPLTRQVALAAVGAVAAAYGSQHPERLLSILPAVLAAIGSGQAAVRGSALAAAAALAAALGPRLVPLLPKTVAAVIGAVKAAAAAVTEAPLGKAQARPDSGSDDSASEGSGSEEEGAGRGGRRGGPGEGAALELGAALAAVAALVEHLGAFLAPHLPLLLGVLLHPAVLQGSAARCSESAASIRQQLAKGVPTRLLLPPLLGHLEPATEAGADSTCGLLRMLQSAVDAMDASALASHHEAVFAALLRALDLRRRRPAALLSPSDELDRVEGAAVACFVGLVLRLTEPRFKPLFFRLLEWAHAVPAGDSDLPTATGQLLRSVALFTLVNALAEALRSVFVPYYGLLVDACVAHLSDGSVAAAGKKGKKKRRKGEEAGAEDGAMPARDALYVEHDWRLRLKVIRALHRCFLYDTGAAGAGRFLDEPRLQRLLPPLVTHLGLQPPPAVAAALEADGAADGAAGLEASLTLAEAGPDGKPSDGGPDTAALLDPFGRAVVAALAQLGVTAGSDALWKPLNHQVLMMTRSLEPRTRLLALEAVAQLAGRLSEEYLALLPETLPFLSELLEDAELAVEARAARLVRQLEALSGESLAQYLS
ncbi:hypothetical protein ABPG77_001343 [Micractinium sp. CCAP 211/92]